MARGGAAAIFAAGGFGTGGGFPLGGGGGVSPPALGSSWTEWSHAWGGEMSLKRALEKLNLEYPHDSD